MTIAVLGPLRVDGDASLLAPRDGVVLEALLLRPGDVVSAERLADAMWGDAPPATWNKVLQGSVMRLRKVLGAGAIETSAAGYRLTTPADEVDAHRFERMVRRSQELLTLGEHDRAAYVSGEALALWRGPALRELERWDPGRVEAGRLEELRLDAEEIRLEASLRAGRHREVLAETQARVAEAPLRERRWALLALAQYQAGRQGDALRTLHRARTVLVRELGVEPGPDLVVLEQAILRQDPSLVAAVALPESSAACPYLGLVPFDVGDTDAFFGRDREVEACLSRLADVGVLAVVGPSGCGKSSLVRAGIAATLQRSGRRVAVITPGARPTDALTALPVSGPTPVLIVDQFEELVTLGDDPAERAAFLAELVRHAERGPLVIALRADRLGELSDHPEFAHLVEPGLHLLSAMSEADLRAAIEGPARQVGLLLEPGLVDLLVHEVEGEPGGLPLLSHALHETWQRREGRTLTVEGYQRTGGIKGAVAQSAEAIYDQVPEEQRPMLRDLLLRLVTPTPEGEPVRSRVPRRTVATDPEHERLIELLVGARLVTSDDHTVELAHESLARAWPRLQGWLDEDVDGQRILRHVALAADAWEGMGRPESELYRGVRLAQALEWRSGAEPALTAVERAFLDTSLERERAETETTEQQLRQQTRQNRRLRALLAGSAALLVVAMVAGLLAFRQANRADRAAVVADARRVGAQALVTDDVDRSLLLAVEGVRLDDSPDSRANLVAALGRNPGLIASTRGDGPGFISAEVSPDGEVAALGRAWSGLSFYSTSTRELLGTYDEISAWKTEYRPDGKQLAVSAQENFVADTVTFPTPALRLVDAITFEDEPVQLGGTPSDSYPEAPRYSADGRFLAVPFGTAVMVWDLASREAPVRTVVASAWSPGVALSPDGRLLFVGTATPPRVSAYEVASGRAVGTADVPGRLLQVSPDGTLLAAAGNREIVLLDAATLTERGRLEGHVDDVQNIQFSHDGALLASGSNDRTAIVWDVATSQPLEQLRGHSGRVWGVDFSPDDRTLYTAGLDGVLLTWDLQGERRWIPRLPLNEPVTTDTTALQASPTGEAVAYIGDPWFVQFMDVATGRAGPRIDTGHGRWGAWAWRPDGRLFATAGPDGFVRVWEWATGELVAERLVAPGHIAALDYTPDGKRLMVGERANAMYLIDAETLQPVTERVQLDQRVVFGFVAPDARRAIAMSASEFVLVDLVEGEVLHRGEVGFVPGNGDFSPDGSRYAVAGGLAGELRVLDVDTGEWVGPPRVAHSALTWSVTYAADGSTFVTAGGDGKVARWDGRTGAPLGTILPALPDVLTDAQYLADGHTLLISSSAGAILSWDTRPQHAIEFACQIAGRNLTPDEWRDALGDRPYHETCPAT